MQQDLFIEKLVKHKRTGAEIMLAVMIVFTALILIILSFLIPLMIQINLYAVSIFVSFAIGYAAFRLITGLSREYEYSIVSDDLIIDRIIAQRKRKNLFRGSCKEFTILAPVTYSEFDSYLQKQLSHLDLRSGEDHGCDWFFVTKAKDKMLLVLFEPDERFINAIRKINPRIVKSV